jgi:HNH endonuclease
MSADDLNTEQWLGLVRFRGTEVSDRGRIRTYWTRYGIRYGWRIGTQPRLRKCFVGTDGYCVVTLPDATGRRRPFKVQHLVLEAFRGPKPKGMVCRHLNDARADNRIENLAWGTPSENATDGYANGRKKLLGTRNGSARFTEDQILEIRRLYKTGMMQKNIAKMFGTSQATISRITLRKNWSHI